MDAVFDQIAALGWDAVLLTSARIVLVLLLTWVVLKTAKVALHRLQTRLIRREIAQGAVPTETAKRVDTLIYLLRQAVVIAIWVVALLVVLQEVGVNIGPVLASAGIAGIAVGFGAQNLVRDVISGFFLILENQVRVGDVAIVNGTGGLVEQVNFRTLVLRDLQGVVHIFPNGTITTLANMTTEWSAYVMDIRVAYTEDIDRVVEIMKEVGANLRADPAFGPLMPDDLEVFGVDDFAESALIIKARLKTRPIKQWEVGREYRRRLKHAFDRAGVAIPFPHRSLHFDENSKPFLDQLLGAVPASRDRPDRPARP